MFAPIPSATVVARLTVTGAHKFPQRLAFAVYGVLDGLLVRSDEVSRGLHVPLPNSCGDLAPYTVSGITMVPAPPQTKVLVIDMTDSDSAEQWASYLQHTPALNIYSFEDRFPCPCCFYLTLTAEPPGSHDICGVCGWEDDAVQFRDPTYKGGANGDESLEEARLKFNESNKDAELSELPRYPAYFEHTFPS